MPKQQELDRCYMQCAEAHAALSKATRMKVGACLVTPNGIVIPGVNGTPRGTSVPLETVRTESRYTGSGKLQPFEEITVVTTNPEVIHAELNAVLKAAEAGVAIRGSTLYVTLSPCIACSAFLIQAGIKEVVYKEQYRDSAGIDLLLTSGIYVRRYINEI